MEAKVQDRMAEDSKVTQDELARLRAIKVGDVSDMTFLNGLGAKAYWVCLQSNDKSWAFELKWEGQLICIVDIDYTGIDLVLTKRSLQ